MEHFLALVAMGILSLAFLSLMQVVSVYTVDQTSLAMHEVNSLAVRLHQEVRFADFLTASDGQLFAHFTRDGEVVSFSAQNERLVRQVNGRGGEILVYHLSGMDVVLFGSQSARISMRSLDGGVFRFYVRIFGIEADHVEREGRGIYVEE